MRVAAVRCHHPAVSLTDQYMLAQLVRPEYSQQHAVNSLHTEMPGAPSVSSHPQEPYQAGHDHS